MMKNIFLLIISFVTSVNASAQSPMLGRPAPMPAKAKEDVAMKPSTPVFADEFIDEDDYFIHGKSQLRSKRIDERSFARHALATLSFPKDDSQFHRFFKKINRLITHYDERINILHIGGSHVQDGTLPHTVRTNIFNAWDEMSGRRLGTAERGMIFPFSTLKTDNPSDYSVSSTGTWSASKNVSRELDAKLGLMGIAAITSDPDASITFNLKDGSFTTNRVRILGDASSDDVYPVIVCDRTTIEPESSDKKTGYEFRLPKKTLTFTVKFRGLENGRFDLRGVMPETDRYGITYTSAGVNGASVPSWLKCVKFEEELAILPPDLVIFGIGINDADANDFTPEKFKANYRKLISRIQKVNPKCAFIFITNNDCYRDHKINQNTPRAERAFKELAEEYGGAVFNVFQIMGGLGSSDRWKNEGYMEPDHIHFTPKGYTFIGDLLSNAIIKAFNDYNK